MGVVFNGDLKLSFHIVLSTNRVLATIKHTSSSRDTDTTRLLCITLVHPILDYASTVWKPHLTKTSVN